MKNVLSAMAALVMLAAMVPSARAAATVATADTPAKTSSGVAYTIPKQWSMTEAGPVIVLTPPEGDVHFAIVDVGSAADASKAVAAAWQLYEPTMHRKLLLSTSSPAREGWDEQRSFAYETSPNEHLAVSATALRKGNRWTVAIVEGSAATLDKRSAAVDVAGSSLRPAGYRSETFAGRKAHRLDAARIAELKSFIQTGMKELDVPGVAIALADHGKVVFEGGFGVRELGNPARVDAHTLFMIASNTKGISTLLLARLVDAGKLRWDEPVTQAYPSFRLGSDETTKRVTIQDLVCACTGLPRKDFNFIFDTTLQTPASTTFDQLAGTEPTSKFGEVFQYNNLMASAAGYIAGHMLYPDKELGAAYDAAMQRMIFDPLGMNETTFDMHRAWAGDHASPHGNDVNGHTAVADQEINYIVVPYRPAGGAWSSAHDFIKYAQNELTPGVLPNGKRFMSAANVLKRREHTVPVAEDEFYGMGLMDFRHFGISVIHHGGDLIGFHSDFIAIPSAGVAAVILTNSDNGVYLRGPFMRRLLEVLYDGKPEAAGDVASAAANVKAALAKERERLVVPAAPDAVSTLASHYDNPELGHIDVRKDSSGVVFDFGLWSSHVASRKNDDGTISLVTIDPGIPGVEFVISSENGNKELVTRDGQHKYVYTAQTSRYLRSPTGVTVDRFGRDRSRQFASVAFFPQPECRTGPLRCRL